MDLIFKLLDGGIVAEEMIIEANPLLFNPSLDCQYFRDILYNQALIE